MILKKSYLKMQLQRLLQPMQQFHYIIVEHATDFLVRFQSNSTSTKRVVKFSIFCFTWQRSNVNLQVTSTIHIVNLSCIDWSLQNRHVDDSACKIRFEYKPRKSAMAPKYSQQQLPGIT